MTGSELIPADECPLTRCPICSMHAISLPPRRTGVELHRLDSLVCPSRLVRRGEALYRAGDSFKSLYAVRAGCLKTVIRRNGQEQVTGFYLAGDPLGLDGVYSGEQHCDAIALEDSRLCMVPFDLLEELCRDVKAVQRHVHRMLSAEIVRREQLVMILGTMTAEQRVATFLLSLSTKMKARGYSAVQFNLRMTREDIGSYLGLKLETVSRMLSKLQKDGMVIMHRRQVRIVDSGKLAAL